MTVCNDPTIKNLNKRAIYQLERLGGEFNYDEYVAVKNGKTVAIYLKEEFSGFAVHLVQK